MVRPDSPLLVRPRLDADFACWLWHFIRNCRLEKHVAGTRAVLALSRASQQAHDDLASDGVQFEACRTGLIMAARSEDGVDECRRLRDELQAQGYEGGMTMLTSREARALEPRLHESVLGGLYVQDDWHLAPDSLCADLVARLGARGTRLISRAPLTSLAREGDSWIARVDDGPQIYADQVAAGAWSKALLRQAGVDILLEAAKGYSVTGKIEKGPRHAVYMVETKVGFTPFERAVRLAGTLELAGLDEKIRPRRVQGVMQSGVHYFKDWSIEDPQVWAGLRPATPTASRTSEPCRRRPGCSSLPATTCSGSRWHRPRGSPSPRRWTGGHRRFWSHFGLSERCRDSAGRDGAARAPVGYPAYLLR
jgi:D-amino-acid dehydrogenase